VQRRAKTSGLNADPAAHGAEGVDGGVDVVRADGAAGRDITPVDVPFDANDEALQLDTVPGLQPAQLAEQGATDDHAQSDQTQRTHAMRLHADCRISTARPERQCRPLISAHSRQSVDGFSDPHANRSARRWVYPLLSCGFWVTLLSSGSPAWAAGKGANKERGTDL